jgi:site-specific recombinase XerD
METITASGERTALLPLQPSGALQSIETIPLESLNEKMLSLWLHGRSAHTQRAYRSDAERFLQFVGEKPLSEVTLSDVQSFADATAYIYKVYEGDILEQERERSAASRARLLSSVKSLLAFGHRLGVLPANVGAPLRLPVVKNQLAQRILEEGDLQKILALETDPRNRVLLRLLYAGGLRVSELCGLTWGDLSPRGDTGQVTILGKGGKTRVVLLSSATWRELMNWKETLAGKGKAEAVESGSPLFRSRKRDKEGGYFLDPSMVLRLVRKAARRAGILLNVSPHWMRHAHASHALDRGAPIHLVQQTLGHASVATTGRYLHARPSDSSAKYLGV